MRDLGKLIVAKGLKKLPKVQKIAQSGHTARDSFCMGKYYCTTDLLFYLFRCGCFSNVELETYFLVWSNPNQSNKRSAVQ